MTYEEIKAGLAAAGFPLTYYQWPISQAPELPYVVYYYPNRSDDPADNVNYGKITALNVELYTPIKSFADEARQAYPRSAGRSWKPWGLSGRNLRPISTVNRCTKFYTKVRYA